MQQIEGVVYHHTGDKSPDPQFAKVEAYHKAEGFPISKRGYHVGYTYFIGKDGTIKQARNEDERGAHTVNCGCAIDKSGLPYNTANLHYVAICLAGKFPDESPTKAQLASAAMLTMDIQARRGIPDRKLLNHRDFKATSCPGIDLSGEVLKVINQHRELKIAEAALNRVTPARRISLLEKIKAISSILFPH